MDAASTSAERRQDAEVKRKSKIDAAYIESCSLKQFAAVVFVEDMMMQTAVGEIVQ